MRNLLFASLGALMRVAAIEHLKRNISRMVTSAAFAAGALFCGTVVLVCLIAALWTYLAHAVGPVWAPLIVGAIFLAATIGLLWAANSAWSSPDAPKAVLPPPASQPVILRDNFANGGAAGLATAAVAGFIVGMLRRSRNYR